MQQPIPFTPTAEDYKDFYGDEEPGSWATIDHETGEIVDENTALAQLDSAWHALAQVRTVQEALDVSNRAAAVAYYLKRSNAELGVQNKAAAVRTLSKYKAARMLEAMPKQGPGEYQQRDQPDPVAPTLSSLGITKSEATQLRALGELDEGEIAEYIKDTDEKGKEITVAGAVKLGNRKKSDRKRRDAEQQAQAEPIKPLIAQGSWSEWLPEQPDCDLLITDPPYSTDVDDIDVFAAEWLPIALSAVRPTGRAYVCIGAYPQEIRAYLNADRAGMELKQILVWEYRNATVRQPSHDYIQNWQAILYFQGPEAPPLQAPDTNEQFCVQNISAPDGRRGERYHAWQKPDELAERLIRHSTQPGDLVLDPFAGTGTFMLAATRLGRVARGCDIDESMLAIAAQRGCDIE